MESCKHVIFVVLYVFINIYCAYGKTAPEFTVTVSKPNFKEIHIPLRMWNELIKNSNKLSHSVRNTSKVNTLNQYKNKNIQNKQNNLEPVEDIIEENLEESPLEDKPVNEITLEIIGPDDEKDDVEIEIPIEIVKPIDVLEESVVLVKPGPKPSSIATKPGPKPSSVATKPGPKPSSVATKPAVQNKPLGELAADTLPALDEVAQQNPVAGAIPTIIEDAVSADPVMVVVQSSRSPCLCAKGVCSCCATIISQKGCANVKFLPEEFAFEMDMTMNGDIITKRKLPISDPPPLCFNPRRAPFMELCAQINNVHFKKENVHMCVDLEASIGGFDLFSWNYNCLKFGNQGLVTGLKPESVTLRPRPGLDEDQDDEDDDDDDESGGGGGFFGLFGGGGGDEDDDDDGSILDLLDDDY